MVQHRRDLSFAPLASPPSRWRRLAAAALLASAAACGDSAPPPKTPTTTDADRAEQAKITESRKRIDAANRAYSEQKYEEARKLLVEASKLEVESQRFDIESLLEKVDKRFAKVRAGEAADELGNKKSCEGAFEKLAKAIDELESEAFTRELRRLVAEPAALCAGRTIDAKIGAGDYAGARAFAEGKPVASVLGPSAKKVQALLDDLVVEGLRARLADDLKNRRWEQASAKIDEAVKKGEASEAHARAARQTLREAIEPELQAAFSEGIGGRNAAASLQKVDKLLAAGGWVVSREGSVEQDRVLPPATQQKRLALATWAEAQRLRAKPLKKADKRFVWGKVSVQPPESTTGASRRDLASDAEVWVIAAASDVALVATEDPGAGLAAQLEKATGWVPLARLSPKSTADRLPPEDQLKGARVWGPLREGDPLYELGVVTELGKDKVTVKRVADDAVVEVARATLRNGRLAAGTKVLTYCTDKGQLAEVAEAMPDGRTVKLVCEGGQKKEDTLASLRSKPELLPPAK
jgi:hypothetical protein